MELLMDTIFRGGFFIFVAIVLLIFRFTSLSTTKRAPYPPGPPAWPVIGNYFEFKSLFLRPEKRLREWTSRYGDITQLWIGPYPAILINSAETAKDLLDKKGAVYSKRPAQNTFRENMWPRLINIADGPCFRKIRRIYSSFMTMEQVDRFKVYQDFESKVMLSELLEQPEEFIRHVERVSASVIFSATYGVRLVKMDHVIIHQLSGLWEEILQWFYPGAIPIDYIPALERLPKSMQSWTNLAEKLKGKEMGLHRAFFTMLKKSTVGKEQVTPECFGKMLIQCQKKEGLTDDDALHMLAMLIGAGWDTTHSVLSHFFKCIAMHPKVLENAHRELDSVVGRDRLPTWEDQENLPYIRGIIKEVHRWCPIAGMGIPHATAEDDIYKGQFIAKGTIVLPNLASLNRDPAVFKNPNVFDPERFIDDKLSSAAACVNPDFKKRDHYHYGFGRRTCQGVLVAESSIYSVVSRILWAFEIRRRPGAPPLDPEEKLPGLVQKPKPYQVDIHSRGAQFEMVIQKEKNLAHSEIPDFDDVMRFHTERTGQERPSFLD